MYSRTNEPTKCDCTLRVTCMYSGANHRIDNTSCVVYGASATTKFDYVMWAASSQTILLCPSGGKFVPCLQVCTLGSTKLLILILLCGRKVCIMGQTHIFNLTMPSSVVKLTCLRIQTGGVLVNVRMQISKKSWQPGNKVSIGGQTLTLKCPLVWRQCSRWMWIIWCYGYVEQLTILHFKAVLFCFVLFCNVILSFLFFRWPHNEAGYSSSKDCFWHGLPKQPTGNS